jgi:hypothetical protein
MGKKGAEVDRSGEGCRTDGTGGIGIEIAPIGRSGDE